MKLDFKDFLWCIVVVAVFIVAWNLKGCKENVVPSGGGSGGVVVERKIDTVRIKEGGLIVKYEMPGDYVALLDSLSKNKKIIDSLYKNRVMVLNEKTTEVTKIIPILDSLGQKITTALELKNGDRVLKLPTILNVSDSLGEWINMRVLVDEKPLFLGAKIASIVDKKEEVVKDNFWRKDVSVMYEQKNPYLNKLDIKYLESKRTVKGRVVKGGILIGIGVVSGIILNNNFKK